MAKQAWRLLKHPDNLFAKIFKARYYRDEHLFEAKDRKYQSYGWSSILSELNLLKKGCQTIIGNGQNTRIYQDNWLPSEPPRPAVTDQRNNNMVVSELIESRGGYRAWNIQALNTYRTDEDKALVSSLFLAQKSEEDDVVWNYTSSGTVTIWHKITSITIILYIKPHMVT